MLTQIICVVVVLLTLFVTSVYC